MGGDVSNSSYCSPKFVAHVIHQPDNGLRRTSSKPTRAWDRAASKLSDPDQSGISLGSVGVRTSLGFRHLAVDAGLISLGAVFPAGRPVVGASQTRALALRVRALAFVGAPLAFVRQPLAIIRDPIAVIGDPISAIS